MNPETFEDYAHIYSELGIALSRANGKMPHGKEWEKVVPTDPRAAAGQWKVWGEKYNIGAVLGPSNLIVVEYDDNAARPKWLELTGGAPTWLQQSGSGKTQAFYKDTEGLSRKAKASLELRAGSHFHVLAPSIHPDTGKPYRWLPGHAPWDVELAVLPEAARSFFYSESEPGQSEPFTEEKIGKGGRHQALVSLAGTLRRRGLGEVEILGALRAFNEERCEPPRSEADLRKIAHDMMKHEPGDPITVEDVPEERWSTLDRIAKQAIRWAVEPILQENAFHVLAGQKNVGKGAVTTYFAAMVTRGELGPKRRVLWIAAGEDSYAIDVRPRIEAAGGDPELVSLPLFHPTLPDDMDEIMKWVNDQGDIGLVVIDPVAGMLGRRTNSNLDSDVRPVLAPLNDLADEHKCIVIGIRHMKKDKGNGALDAVMGSGDWVNIPRSVIGLGFDESDEDIRHLISITGNRSRSGQGMAFKLEGVDVVEGGEPVVKATPMGSSRKDLDSLISSHKPSSKGKQTRERILDILESVDEMESDTMDAQMAAEFGISALTARDIRMKLNKEGLTKSVRKNDEDGKLLYWVVARSSAPR